MMVDGRANIDWTECERSTKHGARSIAFRRMCWVSTVARPGGRLQMRGRIAQISVDRSINSQFPGRI